VEKKKKKGKKKKKKKEKEVLGKREIWVFLHDINIYVQVVCENKTVSCSTDPQLNVCERTCTPARRNSVFEMELELRNWYQTSTGKPPLSSSPSFYRYIHRYTISSCNCVYPGRTIVSGPMIAMKTSCSKDCINACWRILLRLLHVATPSFRISNLNITQSFRFSEPIWTHSKPLQPLAINPYGRTTAAVIRHVASSAQSRDLACVNRMNSWRFGNISALDLWVVNPTISHVRTLDGAKIEHRPRLSRSPSDVHRSE